MLIRDIEIPKLRQKALLHTLIEDYPKLRPNPLDLPLKKAFIFSASPEGQTFWELVILGNYEAAKEEYDWGTDEPIPIEEYIRVA